MPMLSPKVRILALCATYNRRDVTLGSLASLSVQQFDPHIQMTIAVVDDNSTDGTLDAVKARYPDVLTLSTRGGSYWAGAMRSGYEQLWNPERYSHLLVFNDDGYYYPEAVATLLGVAQGAASSAGVVVVASLRDPTTGALSYGGLRRRRRRPAVLLERVEAGASAVSVDTCNMNLTLISAACLVKNKLIGEAFVHGFADFDFGLRAGKNGASILLAPGYLGECRRNPSQGTWDDGRLSFRERWQLMHQPKGMPVRPRLAYLRSHARYVWLPIFVWPYLKLITSHVVGNAVRRTVRRNGADS